MIGPLFTYWSKMDTLIFTVGPGASPCNATIIWQHKHMSKLLVALRSIELQNMTGINNTNNRSVIMKSHVCSYSVCSPFSVFHQAVEGNPQTLCYCNSRVLVHIPCCPSYIPMKLIDSPMLCFNRTIQVWPFLLLRTVFTCCATSPPDAPTCIQRTNQ